ncbi:telomere resolvase, partial [Vibrio lentus]
DNERNKYILRKDKETANTFLSIIEDLKSLKVYPEPYYHLVLSKTQRESIKNKSSENRKERLENGQVTIPYEPCVDLCYELLNSDLHYELALGLGLATGRRFSEIYSTAEFTIVSDYVLM